MISLVRYGFVGFTEVNIPLALGALTLATAALFLFNLRLFQQRLQAALLAPAGRCPFSDSRGKGTWARIARASRFNEPHTLPL